MTVSFAPLLASKIVVVAKGWIGAAAIVVWLGGAAPPMAGATATAAMTTRPSPECHAAVRDSPSVAWVSDDAAT